MAAIEARSRGRKPSETTEETKETNMQANAIHNEAAEQTAPIGSLCELVVCLYDKAIAEFEGAAEAAERDDIVARFQATSVA